MRILERFKKEDEAEIADLESGLSNKWCWHWLEKITEIDPAETFPKLSWSHGSLKIAFKDHIRKIDQPGKAVCSLCLNCSIYYADAGVKQITNHLRTQKHVKKLGTLYDAQTLPGVSVVSSENYGAPTAFYGDIPPPPSTSTTDSAAAPSL